MKLSTLSALLMLLPASLAAQQDPVVRLREVLPASVVDKVVAIVQEAQGHGLPGDFVANRALEASAKGKDGQVIALAAQKSADDLGEADDALKAGGRNPDAGEIEAGATAHGMGVDGKTISALASSAPSGRSLAVPLAVLGALVNRGLPSDDALKVVLARLQAKASNRDLADLPGPGRSVADLHRPDGVGDGVGNGNGPVGAGGTTPSGVTPNPGGPPTGIPSNRGKSGNHTDHATGKP
jgi:hypothetical protein